MEHHSQHGSQNWYCCFRYNRAAIVIDTVLGIGFQRIPLFAWGQQHGLENRARGGCSLAHLVQATLCKHILELNRSSVRCSNGSTKDPSVKLMYPGGSNCAREHSCKSCANMWQHILSWPDVCVLLQMSPACALRERLGGRHPLIAFRHWQQRELEVRPNQLKDRLCL